MHWKRKQRLWRVVVLIVLAEVLWHHLGPNLLFYVLDPWPPLYWAAPFHGRVTDRGTALPLREVIVVAKWNMQTYPSGVAFRQLVIMETTTADDGTFEFRWSRPRVRLPWEGFLASEAPQVLLFKKGYDVELHRYAYAGALALLSGSADVTNGIALSPAPTSPKRYAENLWILNNSLENTFAHDQCGWRHYPRMLRALTAEGEAFAQQKLQLRPPTLEERNDLSESAGCGTVTSTVDSE